MFPLPPPPLPSFLLSLSFLFLSFLFKKSANIYAFPFSLLKSFRLLVPLSPSRPLYFRHHPSPLPSFFYIIFTNFFALSRIANLLQQARFSPTPPPQLSTSPTARVPSTALSPPPHSLSVPSSSSHPLPTSSQWEKTGVHTSIPLTHSLLPPHPLPPFRLFGSARRHWRLWCVLRLLSCLLVSIYYSLFFLVSLLSFFSLFFSLFSRFSSLFFFSFLFSLFFFLFLFSLFIIFGSKTITQPIISKFLFFFFSYFLFIHHFVIFFNLRFLRQNNRCCGINRFSTRV
jgi:hypothetical protein